MVFRVSEEGVGPFIILSFSFVLEFIYCPPIYADFPDRALWGTVINVINFNCFLFGTENDELFGVGLLIFFRIMAGSTVGFPLLGE